MFKASNPSKKVRFWVRLIPINANWLAFAMMMMAGSKRGMLRIAIKVVLLLVLEAMAETMVNIPEKLAEPNKTTNKK